MESVITNEKDERFIELTRELDNEYFMKLGDVVERYKDHNALTDPHIVILALNWGNPIACASFRFIDKDTIEIRRVYVKRRYRRKGIAYKLIKQLEKLAMEENFKYSVIETGKNNEAAINLYKKLDYEIIDNFGLFEGDDLCICMKKQFKSMIF
jgi:ribosomal protein S18 acetylase RimI-like enzyme